MNREFLPLLEKIEESILSAIDSRLFLQSDLLFGHLDECVTPDYFNALAKPASDLIKSGGKRWRPLFLVLCALAYAEKSLFAEKETELVKQNAFLLTPLVEFVHTASLIHDDIEDNSDSRRGKPAAYITYGTDVAINAGSWLYFQAASPIEKADISLELKNRLYKALTLELRRLHLGQAMDITWHRHKAVIPSVEEYLAMVKCKTGTLASLSAKTGCLVASADDDFAGKTALVAAEIGAGFQIIDDVINLTLGNPGKKRGDDIVEGKKSLPVLIFAKKNPSDFKTLTSYFEDAAQNGIESPAVEKAIALLSESGAVEEARTQGINLINESCSKFARLFGEQNTFCKKITDLFTSMIP